MATYNIQSGDTLSKIAQSNNTTVANLMSANPNITDANKISAGASLNIPTVSPVGALPNSNVVNVNTIAKPQSGINVPPTPTVTDTTSTVANAQDAIKNLQAEQLKINQDIATAQQQKLDPLYQQQLDLQAQITGKGAEQLQMEQTAGLAEKRQQLSNLNASIAQQTAKFNSEQYSFSANGNPTLASISRKDDAIQLAMLTAAAQGIQGNITASENSIKNAIDLKYGDLEKKLQYTQDFISKNEAIMTEAQKKVATDRSAQINSQIAQIQKDKEDMTSLITNAVAQGAPTSLTQKAALAKTPLEAAQILGTWAGDYFKIKDLQSALQSQNAGNYSITNYPIGSLTKESGMTINDYLKGIAATESGGSGDYSALGPVVTSGLYAGDRAYGKYQIMGKNIPEWTKQAFGKAMTIQEFLNSPEKQDALAKYRAEKDYAKYGNWDDVASVWFSGKPVSQSAGLADAFGTTVPTYIEKVRRYAGSSNASNNFSSLITQATSAQASNTQKEYKQNLQTMINNGDYKNALTTVENATSKNLTGENKTKYDAARAAVKSAQSVKYLLQQYADNGGDTGLLKGTYESIYGKLGTVNDPKFKSLATDLKIALQQYRNDMSGAAFSPQEAKDYASVNPSGSNKLDLNTSILDGMISNFQRKIDTTTDSQMGDSASKLRELARPNTTTQGTTFNSPYTSDFIHTTDTISSNNNNLSNFVKSLFGGNQ